MMCSSGKDRFERDFLTPETALPFLTLFPATENETRQEVTEARGWVAYSLTSLLSRIFVNVYEKSPRCQIAW